MSDVAPQPTESRRDFIAHVNRCLGGGIHDGPVGASRRFAQLVNECTSANAKVKQLELENDGLRARLFPVPTPADEARYAQASADAAKRRERWRAVCGIVWDCVVTELLPYFQLEHRETLQAALLAIAEHIEAKSCEIDGQFDAMESAELSRSGKWIEDDCPALSAI